jgi:tetratricopeptide (TPR) repeat protein
LVSFFDRLKLRTRSAPDVRNRKSDRVEELLAQVQERPDDWTTENELADALAQQGRVDEAVTRLCAIADRLAADGFVAKAHAIFKKVLRLRPRDEYALSRAAELNAERINQQGFRFSPSGDVRTVEAEAGDAPVAATPVSAPDLGGDGPIESAGPVDPNASTHVDASAVPDIPDAPSHDESQAATDTTIESTVDALMEYARTHPDLIEPVARLAEIAAMSGLDDVHDEAEARLCDLHYRRGDFHAARAVAERLVSRHPGDPRHRARLDFLEAELDDHQPVEDAEATGSVVISMDDAPETIADAPLSPARDELVAYDPVPVDSSDPIDVRATLERAVEEADDSFTAARQLARLDADSGNWTSALVWLERAAAAVPTPADEEELAYEMALVLEHAGEVDRALGVLHEIAAQTGAHYRDVSERILRLTSANAPMRAEAAVA